MKRADSPAASAWCEWCGRIHKHLNDFHRCRVRYARALERVREWLRDREKLELAGKRSLYGASRRGFE